MRFTLPVLAILATIAIAESGEPCNTALGQYHRRWTDDVMGDMDESGNIQRRDEHEADDEETPYISYPNKFAPRSVNYLILPPQAMPKSTAAPTWIVHPVAPGATEAHSTTSPTPTSSTKPKTTKPAMVWLVGAAQANPVSSAKAASSTHVAQPKKGSYIN